jgi:hypothetical protein
LVPHARIIPVIAPNPLLPLGSSFVGNVERHSAKAFERCEEILKLTRDSKPDCVHRTPMSFGAENVAHVSGCDPGSGEAVAAWLGAVCTTGASESPRAAPRPTPSASTEINR